MPPDKHPVVVFDGLCNFCSRSVRFILKNDRNGSIRFVPMQSSLGVQLMRKFNLNPTDTDSFLVIKGEHAHLRSDAALEIAKDLRFPWNWAASFRVLPRSWRDSAYGVIAKNRYRWFGKRESCFVPSPEEKSRFLENSEK